MWSRQHSTVQHSRVHEARPSVLVVAGGAPGVSTSTAGVGRSVSRASAEGGSGSRRRGVYVLKLTAHYTAAHCSSVDSPTLHRGILHCAVRYIVPLHTTTPHHTTHYIPLFGTALQHMLSAPSLPFPASISKHGACALAVLAKLAGDPDSTGGMLTETAPGGGRSRSESRD
jgi:hypothetical protein